MRLTIKRKEVKAEIDAVGCSTRLTIVRYWFIQRKCLNKITEGINMSSKWMYSLKAY